MKLHEYLKSQRIKSGVSQVELSDYMNYGSAQYISNIERGVCAIPYHVIRVYICECGAKKSVIKAKMLKDLRSEIDRELWSK